MSTKRIRSRILEYMSPTLLKELYKICRSNVLTDNNLKVDGMLNLLKSHEVDFVELGPGTNRLAILIDNYVFKLALDKWGMQDNLNEFTVAQELQPYVAKCYEQNELISVHEYVTVISRDEFIEKKEEIRRILSIISEGYLLGDVGTVAKNFCNWGYRDDGQLVILDYAYIYRVQGDELLCSEDQSILEYDENFHNLNCPTCRKKYSFIDVRRRITMEQEKHENMMAKQLSYKLTQPVQEFRDAVVEEEDSQPQRPFTREVSKMREDKYITEEEREQSYLDTLAMLQNKGKKINLTQPAPEPVIEEDIDTDEEEFRYGIIAMEADKEPESTVVIGVDYGDKDGDYTVATSEVFITKENETTKSEIHITRQEIVPVEEKDEVDLAVSTVNLVSLAMEDMMEVVDETLPTEEELIDQIAGELVTTITIADDDTDTIVVVNEETPEVIVHVDDEEEEVAQLQFEFTVDNTDEEAEEAYLEGEVIEQSTFRIPFRRDEEEEEQAEVVYESTVKLTDEVSVTTTVNVKTSEEEAAEALRRELEQDADDEDLDIDEDRIEELADEYAHMEDELDEEINQRRNDRKWR